MLPWPALRSGDLGPLGVKAASPFLPPPHSGPQRTTLHDEGGPLGWRGCVDLTLVSASRRQGGVLSARAPLWGQAAGALRREV